MRPQALRHRDRDDDDDDDEEEEEEEDIEAVDPPPRIVIPLRQGQLLVSIAQELIAHREVLRGIQQQLRQVAVSVYMLPVQETVMITILLRVEPS